eukprot:NODE_593_length_1340_cov_91.568838_g554_i0.p1 GENE.NODE_593_length_1340_cov_91.568838_g554_i0~~NODE_593_length_1340_cov_91.568838_g554_i0.p1  ORF type:complete len:346 (+),score=19.30 NODE_593_length_1340_cov_91.568838_g554_i0:132-1169(+)
MQLYGGSPLLLRIIAVPVLLACIPFKGTEFPSRSTLLAFPTWFNDHAPAWNPTPFLSLCPTRDTAAYAHPVLEITPELPIGISDPYPPGLPQPKAADICIFTQIDFPAADRSHNIYTKSITTLLHVQPHQQKVDTLHFLPSAANPYVRAWQPLTKTVMVGLVTAWSRTGRSYMGHNAICQWDLQSGRRRCHFLQDAHNWEKTGKYCHHELFIFNRKPLSFFTLFGTFLEVRLYSATGRILWSARARLGRIADRKLIMHGNSVLFHKESNGVLVHDYNNGFIVALDFATKQTTWCIGPTARCWPLRTPSGEPSSFHFGLHNIQLYHRWMGSCSCARLSGGITATSA